MELLVIYTVKEGQKQAFFEALEASGAPDLVRAEDGCLRYEYRPEEGAANELYLHEAWLSAEHQKVHLTQPHMETIRALKERYTEGTKLIKL